MNPPAQLSFSVFANVGELTLDVKLETFATTLVVIGPNGSGKSSLLSAILGVIPLSRGYLRLSGETLFDAAEGLDVPLERRQIGYVPQDYGLIAGLSVWNNIRFAVQSSHPAMKRKSRLQRAHDLLTELGLAHRLGHRAETLSGGEKQRVALARALSVEPRALLLDEPLAALDVHTRSEVRQFLAVYLRRLALPTVVVTHDAADAQLLGERVAVLEGGRITQTGSWNELLAQPASSFVKEFVSSGLGSPGLGSPEEAPSKRSGHAPSGRMR